MFFCLVVCLLFVLFGSVFVLFCVCVFPCFCFCLFDFVFTISLGFLFFFSSSSYFNIYIYFNISFLKFIYSFLAVLGFIAAHGLSLVATSGERLFVAVCGLLIAVASLVVEHRL